MLTKIEPFCGESAEKAAEILKNGGIVAIPTETVYGLAANALDENAVRSIFAAKGRPQDNPLIVHISSFEMIKPLVAEIPELAKRLSERFWAGPLTMIFNKTSVVPDVTSGGLGTVAVRMPANEAARAVIEKCGFPLAAPSANISGKPSPTSAKHVFEDMNGKIPLIIDGGECDVGVESTVISFNENKIHILRPGGITAEMLSEFADVEIDKAVEAAPDPNERVISPGMKYSHYSPRANVFVVNTNGEAFIKFRESRKDENAWFLSRGDYGSGFVNFGETAEIQAQRLFKLLREADENSVETVYVETPDKSGVGLAVYNRLIRAAGFKVVDE
ncbi:MAG: threonylcarbamoyl-AMP synthase [Oscillospiraceae bacterium]|nr:threonylcarbamoyl-AMP synthase [Oscillospiraceae bacterium]